mgnify:CR=1 FL=1
MYVSLLVGIVVLVVVCVVRFLFFRFFFFQAEDGIRDLVRSRGLGDVYKRQVLYGLFFAKEPIRKHDECILVEGYTDVISLHQGEITNAVSYTHLTLPTSDLV